MTNLFDPIQIGSMTLRNRTFMAPMSLGFGNPSGVPDANQQEYWIARAKGGAGCIITDATSVDPNTPYLGNTLCFRNEESIQAWKQFTDRIHACGAKIIPQITHPGPESISSFFGVTPVSSSGYLNSMYQQTRALTKEEIPGIVAMYANASKQAKEAGFDGIELHCAHGYMLLGSFLSPLRNKREDEYGGCLENRARLLFEVVDAIKEKCGKDFPIVLRISGSERVPGGNTVEDIMKLVPSLVEHGIDAFEISGGSQYELPNKIIPSHGEKQAVNLEEAEAIRSVSAVPVILVGKINTPELAKSLVSEDKVDAVVIGRAMIADPEFVKKTEEGREDEISPCASCLAGCVGEQNKRRPASCVINPFAGKELVMKAEPAEVRKKVLVAGGGMAGLSAARMAAMRGHEVTLYEASDHLGGQIALAAKVPDKEETGKWITFYEKEMKRLGVNVVMNTPVTADIIRESDADAVIIANGSKPVSLSTGEHICTAHDILSGRTVITEGNVLIVGGMVAVETAQFLDANKKGELKLTMIEMKKQIDDGDAPANMVTALAAIARIAPVIMTETKLVSVDENTAVVEKDGSTMKIGPFDEIVYSVGSKADPSLYEAVKDCGKEVYTAGDAVQAAQALEAVRDGTLAAMKI